MLGTVELRIADHGERTGCEQAAQITIALFAELPSLSLPPLEFCFGTSPIQAEKSRPRSKRLDRQRLRPEQSPAPDRRSDRVEPLACLV